MRMDRFSLVALCLFVIISIPIESATTRNHRSGHIDALEVQQLLKRLNKPPVKSIQSPEGDIIDCILINQQPAFDHPLLKNHVIQMRPSSEPKGQIEESMPVSQLWHTTNETCPEGTVLIRRIKEEDLLRANSLEEFGKKKLTNSSSSTQNLAINDAGHEHAVIDAGSGDYYGAAAYINVWKPQVQQPSEFSLAQFCILGGSGDDLNSIETGWQAFPKLYGDGNPRFFIFYTKDGYQSGCYNLMCPGFVQLSRKITVGATIAPVSVYGGVQKDIFLKVWKDNFGKRWWLRFGNEVMGYWPSSLFRSLANSAAQAQFGGEIVNSAATGHTSTDMGSGHFPGQGFRKAAFFRNIQTVDSNMNLHDAKAVAVFATHPSCYDSKTSNRRNNWGSHFFYGGPGQNPKCP